MKKKNLKSEILASLLWENFLDIRKKRNSLAIMSLEKIMQIANKITFFLPHYGKKQTTNPKLRSLRLGTRN
jgi:phage terminase large subunit-like protein